MAVIYDTYTEADGEAEKSEASTKTGALSGLIIIFPSHTKKSELAS
jgi:hypothetical protein